ncbi:MAG: hypothetical protein M3Y32_03285 [Pseudomonadota bacterium]|nr:hypothetical protein [Pseudomonadota bacterium]
MFVEYEPQTRIEGELQQMPVHDPVTERWRVLAGHTQGRTSAAEVTLFDSVGFALENFSALRLMGTRARELGLGTPIDLIGTPADPRDLYSLLGAATAPQLRVA